MTASTLCLTHIPGFHFKESSFTGAENRFYLREVSIAILNGLFIYLPRWSVLFRLSWVNYTSAVIIETPQGNLSLGIRELTGGYAQKLNQNYQTVGLVFQGRYKAILVEKESYLLELWRYICLKSRSSRFGAISWGGAVEQLPSHCWTNPKV